MNAQEHLLTTLGEECAEVAQRAAKACRFGLLEIQPEQLLTNRQRIIDELNDLVAVAEMLGLAQFSELKIAMKKQKVRDFMEYARTVGALHA